MIEQFKQPDKTTPIKFVRGTLNHYARYQPTVKEQQEFHCSDMHGNYLGPLEPWAFIDLCLAPAPVERPKCQFKHPRANKTEKHMYKPFVSPYSPQSGSPVVAHIRH